MKRLFVLSLLSLAAACADPKSDPRLFDNNDVELAVGNTARMGCSCLWVMNMDETYCRAWVKASPDVAKMNIDWANKRVESSAFLSSAAVAHYVDDKRGCVLE